MDPRKITKPPLRLDTTFSHYKLTVTEGELQIVFKLTNPKSIRSLLNTPINQLSPINLKGS